MPWELPRDQSDRLRLAKGYPFIAPQTSYLFVDGRSEDFAKVTEYGIKLSDRKPVIAHGSNRAPEQLARKFVGHPSGQDPIPLTTIWLHDHDVVYSAHVARYGSVAAELVYCPGTSVQVFLTWLTEEQLCRMHDTELPGGNYSYGHITCRWESVEGFDLPADTTRLAVYRSSFGALNYQGKPVALSAIPARNRQYEDLGQEAVLKLVHVGHGVDGDLDRAILKSIETPQYRSKVVEAVRKQSLDVFHPSYSISR
ncbi:hypothetical protein [Kiloniella litopenaei]|uniref:hypothetical protein n=1 Tax=Kiloniella litopenaei TaxID=1549748 RepID=UPI000698791F|nr:hypothetical protein [Kiloniella litopenaei]